MWFPVKTSPLHKLLRKLAAEDYSGNLIVLSPGKLRLRRPSVIQ